MTDALTKNEWATIIESLGYSMQRIRDYDYSGGREDLRERGEQLRREKIDELQAAKAKAAEQKANAD